MNRRKWLLQSSLAFTGLSILPFRAFALPADPSADKEKTAPVNLSSNENPYGPSADAKIAMAKAVADSNRYPFKAIPPLMQAIAIKNGVSEENIQIGAGSTEMIDLVIQYAATGKGSFVLAGLTFDRWSGAAERAGLEKIAVPLTPDKYHDLPAMLRAIRPDTKLVYVCNPNNPTATICDHDQLVSFVAEATKKTLVLVDEAYLEYANGQSLANLAINNKNLIIVKTFSKIYGLAGARIGYAVAHKDTIDQLGQLRSGANLGVSAASIAGAIASLKDDQFIRETYLKNEQVRKFTVEQLALLNVQCIPSNTNFIYFSLTNYKKDFFAQLAAANILGTGIYEESGKWSRITIGSMKEMEIFIEAIS